MPQRRTGEESVASGVLGSLSESPLSFLVGGGCFRDHVFSEGSSIASRTSTDNLSAEDEGSAVDWLDSSDAADSGAELWCCSPPQQIRPARFHLVPRTGWHPHLREMGCQAKNTIKWRGSGDIPRPPSTSEGCWLLPASDAMSLTIARLRRELVAAGWKLLTCSEGTIRRLGNKAELQRTAKRLGLSGVMPLAFSSPRTATYPCILKAAIGQHGKDVYIANNEEEVTGITVDGFGSHWLLQELIPGRCEYSTSLLVENGKILDAICTEYEYDKDIYIWPDVSEVSRLSDVVIPRQHLDTMGHFLSGFSGICNFNYKVRPTGEMCIFEVNTRVGADLACDVPRDRARQLFETLDRVCQMPQRAPSPKTGTSAAVEMPSISRSAMRTRVAHPPVAEPFIPGVVGHTI